MSIPCSVAPNRSTKVADIKCWMELPATPTARCLRVATSSLTLHGRRLMCLIRLAARSANPWLPCSCWAGTSARISHSGTQCQPFWQNPYEGILLQVLDLRNGASCEVFWVLVLPIEYKSMPWLVSPYDQLCMRASLHTHDTRSCWSRGCVQSRALRPVKSSNSTTPKLKTSLLLLNSPVIRYSGAP